MATSEEWLALAQRCAEAEAPDQMLDAMISKAALGLPSRSPITGSIGCAVALIEEDLPGWWWKAGTCSVSDDACICPDFGNPKNGAELRDKFGPYRDLSTWDRGEWVSVPWVDTPWNEGFDIDRRPPGNVALALCEAYCWAKAEIAHAEEDDAAGAQVAHKLA